METIMFKTIRILMDNPWNNNIKKLLIPCKKHDKIFFKTIDRLFKN